MRYFNWLLRGIVAALAMLPVLYVLAYLILLDPYAFNGIGGVARNPSYRWIESTETETFFKPLNVVDQWIRPEFWYKPGPYDPSI